MTYDIILFTDLSSRFWHTKPAGAYRIASELRNAGYSVKVIDFAGDWFANITDTSKLLSALIGPNTIFIGFSGSFFAFDDQSVHSDVATKVRNSTERKPSPYPCRKDRFDLWCKFFKKKWPAVKLVYGGTNATLSLELNESFDYIVLGLADNTVIELASHLKYKTPLKFNLIGKKWKVIDHDVKGLSFNFPSSSTVYADEDHIFPGEVLTIEISRGCMFKCSFCRFPLLGRGKTNPAYIKETQVLAEEFKRNWDKHRTNKYIIVDDTFNETTEKIQAVINAVKLANIEIEAWAYIRLDLLERFPEQIKLLRELGIRSVYFGIESLNYNSAKAIGKGIATDKIKSTLQKCREEWGDEVAIHTNYIVGLPHDTPDTIREWSTWVLEHDPADSSFFYPLHLSLDPEKLKSNVFNSEFTSNPQKHGYTEYLDGWKNDAWNYLDARIMADDLNQKLFDSGKMKLASMDIMGLMNYGFSFEELKGKPFKDLDLQLLNSKYKEMFEQYKQALFKFEGIDG